MRLCQLLRVLRNCYIVVWLRHDNGTIQCVARGFSERISDFENYLDYEVTRVGFSFNDGMCITIKQNTE